MSRWHDPQCRAPDVVVDSRSDLPVCRACGISFAKSRARTEGQSSLQIPQDEAPGSPLNLYWPATVTYTRSQDRNPSQNLQLHSTNRRAPTDRDQETSAPPAAPQRKSSPPPPPPQPCYTPRLSRSQIRLLRVYTAALHAASSSSSKINHVDLEVYEHNRCPEYETMSYTWGGEDGDSAPTQPVFVGSYWDVVWQTKNCCAMLQYLRPVEGFRLVWVDALCINQQDSREREQQVAVMARIYKEARRVVVYLGSDLVRPTPGTHPRRQKLQDSIVRGAYSYSRPQAPEAERYIPEEDYTYDDGRDPNGHSLAGIMGAHKTPRVLGKHRFFGDSLYPRAESNNAGGASSENSAADRYGCPSASGDRRCDSLDRTRSHKGKGKAKSDAGSPAAKPSPAAPRRRYYNALGHIDLVALMGRRYFSRIWVVQELTLSRQVSIAVGDFEVWGDALTPEELKRNHPGWHWEDTKAPWVRNMAQREMPDMDLHQIMRATAKSESSDPRDRVFGVFALLGAGGRGLEPDYSLSPLHCFVGTCAHLILNLGRAELLRSAYGLAAPSPWPSWMPDYRSTGWVRLLQDDDDEVDAENDPFYKWWNREEEKDRDEEIERNDYRLPKYQYGLFKVSAEALRKRSNKELYEDSRIRKTIWESSYFDGKRLQSSMYSAKVSYGAYSAWNRQASVDAETGGMTLGLIHLLRFWKAPERLPGLPKHIHQPVFALGGLCNSEDGRATAMYLVTDGLDLSTVRPETDHLYILNRQDGTCLFLVLRETAPSTFKLVACVRQIWFCAARESWTRMSVKRTYNKYEENYDDADVERETLRYDTKLFLWDLQRGLFDRDSRQELMPGIWVHAEPDETTTHLHTLLLDPPKLHGPHEDKLDHDSFRVSSPDITLFCQGLINEQRGDRPGVLSSYAGLFNPELNPTVRDDCVEITIPPHLWGEMHGRFSRAYTELFKEWRFAQSTDSTSWSTSRTKLALLRRNKTVIVRARHADIMALGMQMHGYKVLSSFTRARKLTGKYEAQMFHQQDEDGYESIASPNWHKTIVDGFDIDGSTYWVTIV